MRKETEPTAEFANSPLDTKCYTYSRTINYTMVIMAAISWFLLTSKTLNKTICYRNLLMWTTWWQKTWLWDSEPCLRLTTYYITSTPTLLRSLYSWSCKQRRPCRNAAQQADLRSIIKQGSPSKAEPPPLLNYACGLSSRSPARSCTLYLSCSFFELASWLWSFGSASTLNYLNLC